MEKQPEKLDIEAVQELDLKNIAEKGQSNNRIITNENDKSYIMIEYIPEKQLLF